MVYLMKKLGIGICAAFAIMLIAAPLSAFAQASAPPSPNAWSNILGELENIFMSLSQALTAASSKEVASIASVVIAPNSGTASSSVLTHSASSSVPNFIVLKTGNQSVATAVLQRILIKNGYLNISAPTGYFGPATQAAVEAFQETHNFPQTGIITIASSSLSKFFSLAPSSFTPVEVGASGSQAASLQSFLIKNGYLKISAPTGYFGPATQAAVEAFQETHNLLQTGVLDKATFGAMNTEN
jgi:peptidoglycan hydrolase-like protein with peptidoglycan-binding domain